MVFRLMLVDTHRDYVNGPNEMHEVLDQLFQANLISKNSKSHKKLLRLCGKWSQNGCPGCWTGRRSSSHDSHGDRGALPFFYFPIDPTFHNPHFSLSTTQALETKMVSEENSGNCPVCVDPFQIGDQV